MKNRIKFLILILISTSFFNCETDDDDNFSNDNQSVEKFSTSISDFNIALTNYIEVIHKCQGSNFNKMSATEMTNLTNEYITATELFIEAYKYTYEFNQSTSKSIQNKFSSNCFSTVTGGVPMSPLLPVKIGKDIEDVKNKTAQNNKDKEDGKINSVEHKINQDNIMFTALKGLFIFAGAAVLTTGAVLITGEALTAAGAGFIIGSTIKLAVAGVTSGSIIWYAYSDNESDGKKKGGESKYILLTGKTTIGGSIPVHLFPDNSDIVIAIEGYAPVTIKNFKLPKTGINKIIEVDGVKIKDAKIGGTNVVCFSEEKMTALSCTDVQFVNASIYPTNPSPGQGVTVTATLIPIAANCDINFSIAGTDGYSKSETKASNSAGQANFHIPGGEKNVVDVVTIKSSNGKTYTVTYVF